MWRVLEGKHGETETRIPGDQAWRFVKGRNEEQGQGIRGIECGWSFIG